MTLAPGDGEPVAPADVAPPTGASSSDDVAAFRNVAPGQPPIGVFFDRASFFWAIAIVTFSLVALVVHYLSRTREDLEL